MNTTTGEYTSGLEASKAKHVARERLRLCVSEPVHAEILYRERSDEVAASRIENLFAASREFG